MLSELAKTIFAEPEVDVHVISENFEEAWKSYVVLERAGLTTLDRQVCTEMHPTAQEALQALLVDLETRLEAKELEAYRLAREKLYQADDSDETDEAGHI